jgi:hypothetical protein
MRYATPPRESVILIEVKQVGQSKGADRQLFEYAFHRSRSPDGWRGGSDRLPSTALPRHDATQAESAFALFPSSAAAAPIAVCPKAFSSDPYSTSRAVDLPSASKTYNVVRMPAKKYSTRRFSFGAWFCSSWLA